MIPIRRLAGFRLLSDARVLQLVPFFCYAASPILFVMAVRAVTRFAATQFEILLGIVASGTLALLVVTMGLIVALAVRRDAHHRP